MKKLSDEYKSLKRFRNNELEGKNKKINEGLIKQGEQLLKPMSYKSCSKLVFKILEIVIYVRQK